MELNSQKNCGKFGRLDWSVIGKLDVILWTTNL